MATTVATGVGLAVLVSGAVVAIGQMTPDDSVTSANVAKTSGWHEHRHRPGWPHRPRPTTTVTPTARPTPTAKPTTKPPTATAPPPTTTAPPGGGQAGGAPTALPKVGVPAGLALTASGGLTITKAGTVIDAADISGGVTVAAADVTIKRSRISGGGSWGVNVRSGSLKLEDTTVSGFDNSVIGDNYSATRVEVTKANEDGFKIGSNVTIENSYCHDLIVSEGAHSDCGQVQSGVNNAVVRGNWFDVGSRGNAALFMAPDLGPSSPGPLVVENNVLGGGNFTVQCVDGNNGQYFIKDITIKGNKFLRNSQYGPLRTNVTVKASDNSFMDNGKAVTG